MIKAPLAIFFQNYFKKYKDYIKLSIEKLPYRLGLQSLYPGSYLCYKPDRFSKAQWRYIQRPEALPRNRVRDFIHSNEVNNAGDLTRYYFIKLTMEQIVKEDLTGDIAEFGVYKGNTASILVDLAENSFKKLYLFDTFEGFSKKDIQGIDSEKKMEFVDTDIESVKSFINSNSAVYVRGWFPESTSILPKDIIYCLVHIDCDLYAPFKAALSYFYERIVPGGFLIMHDYSSLWWEGAEKAIDEFFSDKPESIVLIPDKSGTAVIRKIKI